MTYEINRQIMVLYAFVDQCPTEMYQVDLLFGKCMVQIGLKDCEKGVLSVYPLQKIIVLYGYHIHLLFKIIYFGFLLRACRQILFLTSFHAWLPI